MPGVASRFLKDSHTIFTYKYFQKFLKLISPWLVWPWLSITARRMICLARRFSDLIKYIFVRNLIIMIDLVPDKILQIFGAENLCARQIIHHAV
jgi:hypothetical protein